MKSIVKLDNKIKFRKLEDLIEEPIIIRVKGTFDEDMAEKFSEDFSIAHNTGQEIIPVIIDSYGGHVDSLISMISDIQNSTLPVATICIGKAMSCGSILLSCGTEGYRFMDANSRVMIHDISSFHFGKNEEIQSSAREVNRLQKKVFRLMAKNCGHKDHDYFLKLIHEKSHANWYLTPITAKKHNLINHIGVPTLTTKVSVVSSFEF